MPHHPNPLTGPVSATPALQADATRIAALSTEELRRELAAALTLSAQHLRYLALVWRELEARGEDLSELRQGLAAYLPLIAAGTLEAEVVVRYAGHTTLLHALTLLPVERQRALLAGEPIPIIIIDAAGRYERREMPAHALTATQIRLALAPGRIRTGEEQQALLEQARSARATRVRRLRPTVVYDARRRELRVGRTRVTPEEILAALAELYDTSEAEAILAADEPRRTIPLSLSEAEHHALRVRAAHAGRSMQALVWTAVRAYGLLEAP